MKCHVKQHLQPNYLIKIHTQHRDVVIRRKGSVIVINTEILLLKCNSQINFAIEMNVIIIIVVVDYHTASQALVSPGFSFLLNNQ